MPVKVYKPTSPGRRDMSVSDFKELTRGRPEKSLLTGRVNKSGGRNCNGRTTSFHRGGGHKRRFRKIDFRREKTGIPSVVAAIGLSETIGSSSVPLMVMVTVAGELSLPPGSVAM